MCNKRGSTRLTCLVISKHYKLIPNKHNGGSQKSHKQNSDDLPVQVGEVLNCVGGSSKICSSHDHIWSIRSKILHSSRTRLYSGFAIMKYISGYVIDVIISEMLCQCYRIPE